jgi:hypothetical protein
MELVIKFARESAVEHIYASSFDFIRRTYQKKGISLSQGTLRDYYQRPFRNGWELTETPIRDPFLNLTDIEAPALWYYTGRQGQRVSQAPDKSLKLNHLGLVALFGLAGSFFGWLSTLGPILLVAGMVAGKGVKKKSKDVAGPECVDGRKRSLIQKIVFSDYVSRHPWRPDSCEESKFAFDILAQRNNAIPGVLRSEVSLELFLKVIRVIYEVYETGEV